MDQENNKIDFSMIMMEKIRRALDDRNLSKVAAQTGLHENTIRSILNGRTTNPTIQTFEKLVQYLFGKN